jgi:glutamate carboxypeptidase
MTAYDKPIDLAESAAGIENWVKIESPTKVPGAVNRMIDRVQEEFRDVPVTMQRIAGRDCFADNLIVRTEGEGQRILVLSHVDTVHPVGTLAGPLQLRRDGDKMYGPGVCDMKGGAYLAMDALRRVAHARSSKLPITFLFTPDEEVGSPTSRALIEAEAKHAKYALVTEAARDGGKIVTARKGVGRFEMAALGVPAHSGVAHDKGRSAIREMAHQILAIEGMTDYARGVTTTVGMMSGGTAANVIPEHAKISIDLRVRDAASGREFAEKILSLKPRDPDVKLEITGGMNRPPFEKSSGIAALFRHAQDCAREIGFALEDVPMTGGGSDGNFTAALDVPTLDGLGVDGAGAHTHWEHGLLSSIVPRTRLLQRMFETLT